MTASVASGFAPATSPVVTTGATAAPESEGGEPGLFATLLALLGPQPAAEGDAAAPAGTSPAPVLDVTDLPDTAAVTQTEPGKSLLKHLGDALIAINDALASGKPIDPALEKQLSDSLDAVAVYLGSVPPAAPPIDPRITADDAAPTSAPALVKLASVVAPLADTLAVQSPELATRLQALAKNLETGTVSADILAQLSSEAAADPEIARIITALSAPKPAAPTPNATLPFTAPTLEMPADMAAPKPAPAAEPRPADKLEAPETITDEPVLTTHVARDTRPADPGPRPATTSAPAPAATSDATAASPATAPAPQPTAVAAARTIHAAYQTPLQQVNLPQVAFEVVRQFEAGNSRFQIRLDPPDLGRIDVRLDVDKSGAINARMTVERPETLDLMQRDQRALQQALQQAGLDGSKTNLEFSLRQNPFAQQGGMGDGSGAQPGFAGNGGLAGSDDASATELATTTYRGTASAGGVNLFV